jgi:dihydrofolate reductase
MTVSAIAAVSDNWVIGQDNQIPWYLPADLKFFKKTTNGHHVIMGRNTFLSIGRALPGRTNIVVTRNPFFLAEGILLAHSIGEALEIALENGETEAFIIGGAQVYAHSMLYWDRLYLTRVHTELKGDTFFPEPEWGEWMLVSHTHFPADERNALSCDIEIYEKKE